MDYLIRIMLFNLFTRILIKISEHIKEAQIIYIFSDVKPTIMQIIGLRKL